MCVLVVEDDFLIRVVLVEELRDAGFEVKEADNVDAAVEVLADVAPPLSVLVTDIHMPGEKNGIDLAHHVSNHHPGVPVIFTTGRPDALDSLGELAAVWVLVNKPYVASHVVETIGAMLPAR